eukprot:8188869-Karenia_brevis.AAC.1
MPRSQRMRLRDHTEEWLAEFVEDMTEIAPEQDIPWHREAAQRVLTQEDIGQDFVVLSFIRPEVVARLAHEIEF